MENIESPGNQSDPMQMNGSTGVGGPVHSAQIAQLFNRIQQEIEDQQPSNVIHFTVDFLCKSYPEHLQGFASIWNGDPHLEKERLLVCDFFKHLKMPSEIATHFTSAGFDTLETLCTLTAESLDDVERFNQARWLPGHKVRLQQAFSDVANRVKSFREERESLIQASRGTGGFSNMTQYPKATFSNYPRLAGPAKPAIMKTSMGGQSSYQTLALPATSQTKYSGATEVPAGTRVA